MDSVAGFNPLPAEALPGGSSSASKHQLSLRNLELKERTIEISSVEFNSILDGHLKDTTYKFKFEQLKDNRMAIKENMQEIAAETEEREEANRVLTIWKRCEEAVNDNNPLHKDDEVIWSKSRQEVTDRVKKSVSTLKALRAENVKLESALSKNEELLKKHVMQNMTSTYVYEVNDRYFKVALGAISLRQPKHRSLDEYGNKLRSLLDTDEKLRELTFSQFDKFFRDYASAAGPQHADFSSLNNINLELLSNKTMSRFQFLQLVITCCDTAFGKELINRVNVLSGNLEAAKDLALSMDEKQRNEELVNQNRAPFMRATNYQKKLHQYKDTMSEEQKKEFGYEEPKRNNNRPRSRPNKSGFARNRTNPWNNSRGSFRNQGSRGGWSNRGGGNNSFRGGRGRGGQRGGRGGYRQNPQQNWNSDSNQQSK
ncbi:unnamed protein product [Oikopleura dioica]|uniref:Uncharacterized protein n=1 Tax=Oikopleura dioica TaxID=34765 RepID=E4WWP7_OIKDI|nr:unnamed protein product [Oikopleura dioica]